MVNPLVDVQPTVSPLGAVDDANRYVTLIGQVENGQLFVSWFDAISSTAGTDVILYLEAGIASVAAIRRLLVMRESDELLDAA